MNIEELAKHFTPYLGWLTALVGWVTGLVQWRKKRKAEAKLKLIRRRGEAPYLIPSDSTDDRLITDASTNQASYAHPNTELSVFRGEVDKEMLQGTPVRLLVDNQGEQARRVSVTLDGEAIPLRQEPQLAFANGLLFLEYPYVPAMHGKEQRLEIAFETLSGIQNRHVYLTKHGVRSLTRIDPARNRQSIGLERRLCAK